MVGRPRPKAVVCNLLSPGDELEVTCRNDQVEVSQACAHGAVALDNPQLVGSANSCDDCTAMTAGFVVLHLESQSRPRLGAQPRKLTESCRSNAPRWHGPLQGGDPLSVGATSTGRQ